MISSERVSMTMIRCVLTLALATSILGALAGVAGAIEIPFEQLFFGNASTSLIEEQVLYPDSYVSIESGYWDLYYERKADRLHDYHQSAQRLRSIFRRRAILLGFEVNRMALSLKQDNVYTDADRLRGEREHMEGRAYLGLRRYGQGGFAGMDAFEVVAATGWKENVTGEVEAFLGWSGFGSMLLCAEVFSNRLEIVEDINGYRFPFHFPFRTERLFGRVESSPLRTARLRLWGGVETSRGEGEKVSGFENRLWFRRHTLGASLDYRLQPDHPRHKVARLQKGAGHPGLRLSATHHLGNGDVGMYFDDVRYLHLQDLNSRFTTVRVDLVPVRDISIFAGWQRLGMTQDGDSFFDPWPFIVWDVFLAKRYRLDDVAMQLDTWYAGLGKIVRRDRFELEVSGRFEWWKDTGGLDLLERVDVLFPFFFEYDRSDADIDIPFRYAVQLDPSFTFSVSRSVMFRLFGRVMVPFGKEEPAASPPPADTRGGEPAPAQADDGSTHGGLTGFFEIIYSM